MSPILSTIESTLTGITTIRAFRAEGRFLEDFFDMINKNTGAEWYVSPIDPPSVRADTRLTVGPSFKFT
jgi:hypothetical protein